RNLLLKYPEVNAMQKKMMRVSNRVERLRNAKRSWKRESSSAAIEGAYEKLLAGECNCPYWHGVFGGLYLANIRAAIYRALISAERELDPAEGVSGCKISVEEYDLDGRDEVILENG